LVAFDMRPKGPANHFILAFLLALAGYIIFYQGIEHRRTRSGPWRVTFTTGSNDVPTIVVDQPRLAVTNVQIRFAGEALIVTNGPTTVVFGQPRPVPYEVPFGTCVFMDTTFLPGTVTLQLFGHEIELLPRVLVVDRLEHPWRSGTIIALPPAPAAPAQIKKPPVSIYRFTTQPPTEVIARPNRRGTLARTMPYLSLFAVTGIKGTRL
jgi:hypothetical protein